MRTNRGLATIITFATILGAVMTAPSVAQDAGGRGKGTDNRQWVDGAGEPPESMSPADHQYTTSAARVPMRDGTMLDAVLYLPTRPAGEEPGPCVVWAEGYSPPSAIGPVTIGSGAASFEDLARRGYAGAHVMLRGQAPEGDTLYYKYAEDGYDMVEWAAEQDWCDGNVGMMGASLNGISGWLTAQERPPHLKAIVPQIGCGDCYWYLWNKGGTLPGSGREGRRPPLTAYDEYDAGSRHPDHDEWWAARNTTATEHEAMGQSGIAVMQCGGWDDYIFAGGVRAVEQLMAAGGAGMQVIGPCAHGGDTPTLMPYDIQTHTVLWFDRYLKGIDNGIGTDHEALFYVQGAEQYRYEPQWPIPDTRWARMYLRGRNSGSATSLNDGSLAAVVDPGAATPATYDYSPDGPHNNAGGGTTRPSEDQRDDESHSLTWTTEPLEDPTEVTGWPNLTFWASASAPDTDFVAEITDVAPDGTSTTVSRGWLNAPHAFDRTTPEPLTPGKVYRFDLELWPLSYVFAPGHRIRVDLAGSDDPGTAPNATPAKVTIYQDAEHPSHVALPIIGSAKLPGEKPPVDRCSPAPAAPYSDRDSIAEAHRANVDCATLLQIVRGLADDTYRPGRTVRRDQLASFVVQALDAAQGGRPLPSAGQSDDQFTDIDRNTHRTNIKRLHAAGIIRGRSVTRYAPADPVSRDELATFLVRAAEWSHSLDRGAHAVTDHTFADVGVDNTHHGNVNGAAELGLVRGDAGKRYHPGAATRRDQMASVLVQLQQLLRDGAM